MSLPVNIEALVHGNAIEWERLEFKRGWNPEEVVHTLCAFANDLNNWGGGYVIVGIEEHSGQPVLPPHDLEPTQLDSIQGKVIELGNRLQPGYFPIIQPYVLQGKHILVLWCPAGDNRPYTAPATLAAHAQRQSYVRRGSRSIVARGDDLRRLTELAARIPFDDRINHQATIRDLDLGLIQAFLQEVKSDLFEESKRMSMAELTRNMLIAKGADEDLRPVNAGLLFFSKQPERFFPRTWIELIVYQDDSGTKFTERYFKGALHVQLRDALNFLRTHIIREQVQKVRFRAEAVRFYNFPYDAVEEALSNAVYHKSYEIGKPIEVQVWKDKIEILSYPGPVPPVDAQILHSQRRIVARDYRNRRIGDFLKELNLTEGRGTGFPTMYRAMANNGSPDPIFHTDAQSTHFLATLPAHALAATDQADQARASGKALLFRGLSGLLAFIDQAGDQAIDQVNGQARGQALSILEDEIHGRAIGMLQLLGSWTKREELFKRMALSNHSSNRKKYLDPLIKYRLVVMEHPNTPTHPYQRYIRTALGNNLLKMTTKK